MSLVSHARSGESLRAIRKLTTSIGGSLDEMAVRKSRVRTGWWPEMQVLTLAIRDLEGKCWPKDELLARLNSLLGEVVGLFEDYHSDLELFMEDNIDRKMKNLLSELDTVTLNADEEFEDLYASMKKYRDKFDLLSQELTTLHDVSHKADNFERKCLAIDTENKQNRDLIQHLDLTVSRLEEELVRREGASKQLESTSMRLDRSERRCVELERLLSELTSDNEHLAKTSSERLDAVEKLEERLTRFARRNEMLERENAMKENDLTSLRDELETHIKRESRDRKELDEIVKHSKSFADETEIRNKKLTEELDRLIAEEQRLTAQTEEMRGLMELYKDKYKKEKLTNRSALGLE